jgi:hypothetical protein
MTAFSTYANPHRMHRYATRDSTGGVSAAKMGAIASLIGKWVQGLCLFAAGTAALVFAFSFAIAGPPTDEEMAAVSGFVTDAMEEGGALAERAAASLCADYDICGPPPVTVAEAPAPAPSVESPPSIPKPEPVAEAAPEPITPVAPLLGDRDNETPRIERHRSRTDPPARRRAERSPRPAPLEAPHRSDLAQLVARERAALADLPAAYQPDLGPNQDQQTEVAPYEDDYGWQEGLGAEEEYPEEEEPEPYWYGY